MISSGAIPMKGVPNGYGGCGNRGIGTGAPGKLIVADGMQARESRRKCAVIRPSGAEGTGAL